MRGRSLELRACAFDDVRAGRGDAPLHSAATATLDPIRGERLYAVARRARDGRTEVGAAVHGNRAEHRHRRAAKDSARLVEALDLEAHVLRGPHRPVVDIPLDGRLLATGRHLPLDPEVALEALGSVGLRRDTAGASQ